MKNIIDTIYYQKKAYLDILKTENKISFFEWYQSLIELRIEFNLITAA